MSIDWITVSAQIINFLILVWILKHFLYQPVILAMDQREQRVMQRLKEANQREQAADLLRQQLFTQQTEFEKNRQNRLRQAQQEADELKLSLLNEARIDVSKTRDAWQRQAELEKKTFVESLQQRSANSFLTIARKALSDLANADLETQLINVFVAKLNGLSEAEVERLKNAIVPIEVVSSSELSQSQTNLLVKAIKKRFDIDTNPNLRVSNELGFGLQINAEEQRLEWNLTSYLDDLGEQFDTALASSKAG